MEAAGCPHLERSQTGPILMASMPAWHAAPVAVVIIGVKDACRLLRSTTIRRSPLQPPRVTSHAGTGTMRAPTPRRPTISPLPPMTTRTATFGLYVTGASTLWRPASTRPRRDTTTPCASTRWLAAWILLHATTQATRLLPRPATTSSLAASTRLRTTMILPLKLTMAAARTRCLDAQTQRRTTTLPRPLWTTASVPTSSLVALCQAAHRTIQPRRSTTARARRRPRRAARTRRH